MDTGSSPPCRGIDEFREDVTVKVSYSNDAQTPYRLLPDTGHVYVARSGQRYVHVTGAHQQRIVFLSLRYKSGAFGFLGVFFTNAQIGGSVV
jgi:hypothetical protein